MCINILTICWYSYFGSAEIVGERRNIGDVNTASPPYETPPSHFKLTLLLGQLSAVHGNLVVSVCQVGGFDLVDEGADDQAGASQEEEIEVSLALLVGL